MPGQAIEAIVAAFEANRSRFEMFCRSLTSEQLGRAVPDSHWRVKDFVSHLASLDTVMIAQAEALSAGRIATLDADGQPFDIDAWNEAEVQARRDWSLDEILAEAAENRKRFLSALRRLTDEQIEQTMHFTGDNKRDPADVPYRLFLNGLARHDPIHAADMVKALPERASDPDIKEWLDDSIVRWYQAAMAGPAKR